MSVVTFYLLVVKRDKKLKLGVLVFWKDVKWFQAFNTSSRIPFDMISFKVKSC